MLQHSISFCDDVEKQIFFHISAMLHCCGIHRPLSLPQDDDPFEMHNMQQQRNIVVVVAKM
jgi:hypothetical protein